HVVRKPLSEFDGTAVVLDHMPHEGHRARGSGAKKAKPEVAYIVTAAEPFNRRQIGRVKVELDKDREGWLPFAREIRIGATECDGFVFEELAEGAQINRVKRGRPSGEDRAPVPSFAGEH